MSTSWTNICLFATRSYASSGEVDKSVNNLRAGPISSTSNNGLWNNTEGKAAWGKTEQGGEFTYAQPWQKNKCTCAAEMGNAKLAEKSEMRTGDLASSALEIL